MTKSEYFEKNKISFAEAMKIFNKQKSKGIKSFDEFLASEHVERKFKVDDIIVLQLNEETKGDGWKNNVVFKVIDFTIDCYMLEYLTPSVSSRIGDVRNTYCHYIDKNCILY